MSISAMKQALDLLETSWGNGHEDTLKYWNETAQVLRQAIAEAEKIAPSDYPNSHQQEPDDDIYDIWVETPCKTHPDAPHGFDRNASHSADRYVCECEGWEPPETRPAGGVVIDKTTPAAGAASSDEAPCRDPAPI